MPRPYETAHYFNLPDGCPTTSPWGGVQDGVRHAEGLYSVSTASHGGIKVDAILNETIPAVFRADEGWYEEDADLSLIHI